MGYQKQRTSGMVGQNRDGSGKTGYASGFSQSSIEHGGRDVVVAPFSKSGSGDKTIPIMVDILAAVSNFHDVDIVFMIIRSLDTS